jgi:EAL domain-containing protein (putative c-di-GMP-specific phosphodiesterase class I)
MFRAKRQGGPKIQHYERRLNQRAGQRLKLENALRGAIAHDELTMLYQPIVDTATGEIIATEALLRWKHPEFGTVSPERFIPLAEEMGLIHEIGEWSLLMACRQTHAWRKAGHAGLKVAVNASADQFLTADIAARIPGALHESGLDPDALELEITETAAMKDPAAAVAILQSLKSLGVQIAIDDFGTGFSSLSYLKRFPIDILKLDRSFVRDLPENEEDKAIVRMVSALGSSLGLVLHAEGVETSAQRDLLRSLGYRRAQGHLFSTAVAAEDMECLLAACGPASRAKMKLA